MKISLELNTGSNPDPIALQQMFAWAAKLDVPFTFEQSTIGDVSHTTATGATTLMMPYGAPTTYEEQPQDLQETVDATGEAEGSADVPSTDPGAPKKRGRKPKNTAEQQTAAMAGTVAPPSTSSSAAVPPGFIPGAPPAAPSFMPPTPPPAAIAEVAPPAAQTFAIPPGVSFTQPAATNQANVQPFAIPPQQQQAQPIAMPTASAPANDTATTGGISNDDLRSCLTELNKVKVGAAFKVMQSGAWPSDNSPKARWFSVESVPDGDRERLMGEMAAFSHSAA